VDNDATLEISAKQAIIHAKAGADVIAPSGMMDNIITTLRKALDENGFSHIPIMSYSTKFASSFYGPFRDAAESAPSENEYIPKNRKTYQMDYANRYEAIRESIADMNEGADILMVKPVLSFMDIIREVKDATKMPLCVYNVSGGPRSLRFCYDYDRHHGGSHDLCSGHIWCRQDGDWYDV
jgi:porphobilinogen synthase